MEGTASNSREAAFALARLLAEHKGGEVLILDLAVQAGWTDFFVIATATSGAHIRGLARFVDETLPALGLSRLNRASFSEDDEWILADLGTIVVHLMTERTRAFYELEKLWFQAEAFKVDPPLPPAAPSASQSG
jgi:ribosome-associated protein